MKMTNLIMVAAIVAGSLLMACTPNTIAKSLGDNHVSVSNGKESEATVSKTVSIWEFDEIYATQGIKVVFTQGKNPGTAKIATTPSAEKYLRVEMDGHTLKAFYKNNDKGSVDIKGPSIIYVSSPTLNEVELSSAACLNVKGDLKVAEDLDIDISSSASVAIGNVYCEEMKIEASSAADINCGTVYGKTFKVDLSSSAAASCDSFSGENLKVDLSSAAWFNCASFKGGILKIDASSAGKANIQNIDCQGVYAEASSGSKIILSGKTLSFSYDVSSGGRLDTRSLQTR